MYEVELKVRADHGRVRERLDALGAERVGGVTQADTYYDAPHRDFAATDEAFRLREETRDGTAETRITYKGPKIDAESKTREELETTVGDAEVARELVESLGFEPVATVRKNREYFSLSGFTVTLDAVEGVGEFVEVETDVETEPEIESARESAAELLDDLGLDIDDQLRISYLELLLADATDTHE
ncbi:class IV adenylate cyclase [Halapricum desulfuricans]|uniref:Adenylate cyclase, class 2 (Thermophilic) n=1 Tax=Halapricum desulfuricans TaxID=2841257 RepID=A0A897NDN1_9EURY|nr:class IV adenylate cyclase [Halapricum desulfuricans]QSG10118.1 Adenylate cyclase, class 2 (thermophilic) [Halapricum desulfuricans]QSG10787.1 Adenylate cyclase, class 2 (thermophilic) [Halapricum desulfuricans]